MTYTQIKIKAEYRDKLSALAASHSRSMANMVEVLIDQATVTTIGLKHQADQAEEHRIFKQARE